MSLTIDSHQQGFLLQLRHRRGAKQPHLTVRRLNAPAGDVKILRIYLYPYEHAADVDARDTCRDAAHKRIKKNTVRTVCNQPLALLLTSTRWMIFSDCLASIIV